MKVVEFEFPNTAVFLTRWYDFEIATDDLDGFRYVWFKHGNSPYTDRESVAMFFVSVDDSEEGDCVLNMFRECPTSSTVGSMRTRRQLKP